METKKMKVWLYRDIKYNFDTLSQRESDDPEIVLLADPIEVEFVLHDKEKVVSAQITSLEAGVEKMRAEHTVALNRELAKIQELKAISYDEEGKLITPIKVDQ